MRPFCMCVHVPCGVQALTYVIIFDFQVSGANDIDRFYCYGEFAGGGLVAVSARAGNVIGGGDWAADRIVPDAMRALTAGEPIAVRNPVATRPWQHVLEPLAGYLQLAQRLRERPDRHSLAYNFGPVAEANRPVQELVEQLLVHRLPRQLL